jgi:hypothetical protein
MTMDPTFLPPRTYYAYRLGRRAWSIVVQAAIHEGIRDKDCLADIVFYLNHPEMQGRPITLSDAALIDEWKRHRSRLFTYQLDLVVESSVRGYDGVNRMWRSRNGHVIEGRPIGMDMWSWHEAAQSSGLSLEPQFTGGVRVSAGRRTFVKSWSTSSDAD